MLTKSLIASILLAAGFASASSTAFAQSFQQPRAMATVVSSTPITQQVTVPQQYCHTETIQVRGAKSGAGAVMGGIAGGAIGNQVGQGSGNVLATVLGVGVGAAIGNNIEGDSAPVTKDVQKCQTENVVENRITGYDLVYSYAGIRYTTHANNPHAPGFQFPVSVTPAY